MDLLVVMASVCTGSEMCLQFGAQQEAGLLSVDLACNKMHCKLPKLGLSLHYLWDMGIYTPKIVLPCNPMVELVCVQSKDQTSGIRNGGAHQTVI